MGEDKGRYNNDKLEYMKYLKIRWIAVLLVAVGTSFFFGFKSGDNRSFQVAKNLDIFNSIVKELDMFYVDTIDPNKTIYLTFMTPYGNSTIYRTENSNSLHNYSSMIKRQRYENLSKNLPLITLAS